MAITQTRLKEILDYDPAVGTFTWKSKVGNRVHVGDNAGSCGSSGYYSIQIAGKLHLSHRLAWLFMTGEQPATCIDHINGTRTDNRFCNLRAATNCQNLQNQKVRSVFSGTSRHGSGWRAKITANKVVHNLGVFPTSADAHAAYLSAKHQLHGAFSR